MDVKWLSRCGLGVLALLLSVAAAAQQDASGTDPLDSGLIEETGQRLIQLGVSFSPKKDKSDEPIPDLSPADFHLVINTRTIDIEYADRICTVSQDSRLEVIEEAAVEPEEPASIVPPPRPATYIFYLEHTLMTMLGQNIALDMTRRLIPELVRDGNRGMIVSSGSRVLQSEFSEDPRELLEFIDDVAKDKDQWTEFAYAQAEERRYEEIFSQPTDGAQRIAARAYHLEEMRKTSNRMRRLSAMIGGMAQIDQPKAIFYFADMARKRPGEHFIKLFTANTDEILGSYSEGAMLNHTFAFDDVLEEANAQGVRLYTVQAQGMKPMPVGRAERLGNSRAVPDTRIVEAEETMRGFAAETGGEMFYGGVDSSSLAKVLRTIEEDFGCFYLLSFYPTDLPEDQTLRVRLTLNETEPALAARKHFNYSSRGQLVIQSRKTREESLLLAAHLSQETVESDPGRGVVIPLAYGDGSYKALVQFVVRGSEIASQLASGSLWDLGMTHMLGPDVKGSISGRVSVPDPTVPVVLETTWSFAPGVNEIISVGREHRLGQLATAQIDLDWPDPNKAKVVVSPIAVVQEYDGVFVRRDGKDEQIRTAGTLGVGGGTVRVEQPAYLIELVCRGKRTRGDFWIQRTLAGETAVDFDLLHWPYDGERCIQVRDLLHAGQMGWGDFVYEVAVFDNETLTGPPLARAIREFVAESDEPMELELEPAEPLDGYAVPWSD
jgi:VWFA-related protein